MKPQTEEAIRALGEERKDLVCRVPNFIDGLSWCRAHSDIADRVVRLVYEDVVSQSSGPAVALLATGGYGRREMSPFSDIDLTLISPDESSAALDNLVRAMYQGLHWAFYTALGLEVGWAYRLVSDAPALDVRTQTGLLDGRLLAGAPELHRNLMEAFWDNFSTGDFLLAKITERGEMFRRHHDTPLVVEPSLKEGAGGLRCFHCANWIRIAIGERPARPNADFDTVVRFRNLLHYTSKKKNDQLTRAKQADIADTLTTDPFILLKDLSPALIGLHQEYHLGLEKLHEARYSLSPGVMAIRGEARVVPNADAGEAAIGIGLATSLGLRVADLPVAARSEVSGSRALHAISTGEGTLRSLDRCGLLERLLPELTLCRTLMPTDSVHVYTVFEHTMRVVRQLDEIQPGTFLGDVKDSLSGTSLLYLAALLHDVGKIEGEPHEEFGARMAEEVCRRWDLAEPDRDKVVWLVRQHLEMARFIRIRDIQNPQTISAFAAIVGDMERLNLLTLLTWADITGVAPGALTTSQEAFLRELHSRTVEVLHGEAQDTTDPAVYRRRLMRELKQEEVPEDQVAAFVESLPAHYLTSTEPDLVRLHMSFAKTALEGDPTVEIFHQPDIGATDVTVCALDSPGLLSRMLGVIYALNLSVIGIRASTTATPKPVALDVFTVTFGSRPVPAATCRQLSTEMTAVLKGERDVAMLLQAKGLDPGRQQKNFQYTYIEGSPGILEVAAPRGRGMAYRFSRLIAEQGWNIVTARVSQWAGNGVAAFYLLGSQGEPLKSDEVKQALSSGQ